MREFSMKNTTFTAIMTQNTLISFFGKSIFNRTGSPEYFRLNNKDIFLFL